MPEDKHVVRILGSYSLLPFFTREAHGHIFELTTNPECEAIFSSGGEYARGTKSFELDLKEKEFELQMTNLGFIREAFWNEAFPRIFKYKNVQQPTADWYQLLPNSTREQLDRILSDHSSPEFAEAFLYHYSLRKLGEESQKIRDGEDGKEQNGELRIHIGLNKFGIANVGITIEFERLKCESFEELCRRAYKKVAHLQEDPLKNLENDHTKLAEPREESPDAEACAQTINSLKSRNSPRLITSYFQALAITTIHQFLFEKLDQFGQQYWDLRWRLIITTGIHKTIDRINFKRNELFTIVSQPWLASTQIADSTNQRLPPPRHVVFIYQLVHKFHRKEAFLNQAYNRLAILTLGHNVGWYPSNKWFFPPFKDDSRDDPLKDSSLLENSCCFVFPQGLVVVLPPSPEVNPERHPQENTVYPGGCRENNSSTEVTYLEYWELIFKLFIRVVEARLLMGMVNRYLSDIHKSFLEYGQLGKLKKCVCWTLWVIPFIPKCCSSRVLSFLGTRTTIQHIDSQLMHVGWILQRTSGRVITPEVTRYSFVRKKLASFMESVNFEEHRKYIQSEYEKLNQWVDAALTAATTRVAIIIAVGSLVVASMSLINDLSHKDTCASPCPASQEQIIEKEKSREAAGSESSTLQIREHN